MKKGINKARRRRRFILIAAGAILGVSLASAILGWGVSTTAVVLPLVALVAALAILVLATADDDVRPGPSIKRVKFLNDKDSGKTVKNVTCDFAGNPDGSGVMGTISLASELKPGEETPEFTPQFDRCRAYVFKYERDSTAKKATIHVLNDNNPDMPATQHDLRTVYGTFLMQAANDYGVYGDIQWYEEFQGDEQWDDDHGEYFQDANDT